MMPARLRHALLPGVQRLYLQTDGGQLIVSGGDDGDTKREVARYELAASAGELRSPSGEVRDLVQGAREVVLCLPRDKALIRNLTLPLAALENLREVLGFEIDRQTPVGVDQVYYDHRVTGRKPADNSIEVELVVTPREYLDDLLGRLSDLGFRPHQATICAYEDDIPLAVNLLPERQRRRRPGKARNLNMALGLLAIALLISAVSLPLLNQRHTIKVLEARLELLNGRADTVRQLRAQVERLEGESRFLVNKKQSRPLVLELVSELTRILPDDTWITRLDFSGLEFQLQGQSKAAAALIPLIESSPLFQNARFRSPVTRIGRTDDERFHLSAAILPSPAP
jgi:general secretion pathway protein L